MMGRPAGAGHRFSARSRRGSQPRAAPGPGPAGGTARL